VYQKKKQETKKQNKARKQKELLTNKLYYMESLILAQDERWRRA
jgi:hypothetical protein